MTVSEIVKSKSESETNVMQTYHLPDKAFVDKCTEIYGINRGIFNVVDKWFFNNGFKNIVKRRKIMTRFFTHINQCNKRESQFVKFGNGGLKRNLNNFVTNHL